MVTMEGLEDRYQHLQDDTEEDQSEVEASGPKTIADEGLANIHVHAYVYTVTCTCI